MADIFVRHGSEYLKKYGNRMLPSHLKAMRDILLCRTRPLGGQTFFCKDCGEIHYAYHSCSSRSCPRCQNNRTTDWLEKQNELLLPASYFMATVTLPALIRPIAKKNQKKVYSILFKTSAEAILKLAKDKRFLGGMAGLLGVLQTWRRDLLYHLHIHYLIPGIGISDDRKKVFRSKQDFLMHANPLGIIFKEKFRDAMKKAGLYDQIPKKAWNQNWVIDIKPVGNGLSVLKYLAPYIFRAAISEKNILKLKNRKVTFRYKDSDTKETKFCTLDAIKFISRFFQHVLPKGFVKVRYYGFLHPKRKDVFKKIKELLGDLFSLKKPDFLSKPKHQILCPKCGKEMIFMGELPRTRAPPLRVILQLQGV
jgi:hypothetical protein